MKITRKVWDLIEKHENLESRELAVITCRTPTFIHLIDTLYWLFAVFFGCMEYLTRMHYMRFGKYCTWFVYMCG